MIEVQRTVQSLYIRVKGAVEDARTLEAVKRTVHLPTDAGQLVAAA
jgi:hypothetical protein